MSKIGRLTDFDVSHPERWNSYVARVENYFRVNQIREDGLKAATLLCACGQEAFDIAENLVAPAPLESVAYTDLKKMLKEHFQPKLSVIAWRHAFEQRDQRPGESAADFIAALSKQQDLVSSRIWKRGSEEAAGGAVKALRLARNPPETVTVHQEDAREGSEVDPEEEVDRLHQPAERRQKGRPVKATASLQCFGCGGHHKRADCRFRSAICRACGRQGHIASVCLGRQKVQPREQLLQEGTRVPSQNRVGFCASQNRNTQAP
ncbi:hypothetical protein NXF25_005180 [Crotalus adamanteus]|uniref:CCHC-type domain-containing protein n=1 Tax=Crotalus adamanteus TaxID=8729 RepID=A0AAW1BX06_CROAD